MSLLVSLPAIGQQIHDIRAVVSGEPLITGQLRMGDPGPAARALRVTNQYLTIGGKPTLPVMGEFHFSRYPRGEWKDVLLKMKADGIGIVSTYVFWIYHEQIEGQFDWNGNKDLRYFLELCQRYHLMAMVRIGPWCHGEVRNGGTPDWILEKKHLRDRSDDPVYQHYVQMWYHQVAAQMKGLLYKDGGPVIGVQLDNEYRFGKKGEAHIMWLKRTAIGAGIDVPLYTVTGWGNASVPPNEVIPLFGGYPGAPWNTNLEKITANDNYTFTRYRNEESIGNEKNLKENTGSGSYYRYPYLTCELGIGNEDTYHRRPVFSDIDGLAIATAKLGSGSNLIGYYMFCGGTNETGKLTSLEEDQDETGYWNRYPKKSYDFQAAIRETGELSPAYFQLKRLHYFLREFGSDLATMQPVFNKQSDPRKDLQFAVRVKKDTGYLFGINYYRGYKKPVQKDVQFHISLPGEELDFPEDPVDIPDSCVFIWPFNFRMGGALLKYATAQPLCHNSEGSTTDWFFVQNRGIPPELSFDATTLEHIESTSGEIHNEAGRYLVTHFQPGVDHFITLIDHQGRHMRVFVLSYAEGKSVWLFHRLHRKILVLSRSGAYLDSGRLHLFGPSAQMKGTLLTKGISLGRTAQPVRIDTTGLWTTFAFHSPEKKIAFSLRPTPLLAGSQWLETTAGKNPSANELWHRFFIKEFELGNPPQIRSASLLIASTLPGRIRVNHRWVNQPLPGGGYHELDLTGYVTKGANTLLVEFPYTTKPAAFAALLRIRYANTDEINIATDTSWLTTQAYVPPAPWRALTGLTQPSLANASLPSTDSFGSFPTQWQLRLQAPPPAGIDKEYLHLRYTGDRATARLGYQLINDQFNNGHSWHIALNRYPELVSGHPLRMRVYPLKPGYRIYFDNPPSPSAVGQATIGQLTVIPEYHLDIPIGVRNGPHAGS